MLFFKGSSLLRVEQRRSRLVFCLQDVAVMAVSCLTRALRSLSLSRPVLVSSQVKPRARRPVFPSRRPPILRVCALAGGPSAEAGRLGVQRRRPVARLPDHSLPGAEQNLLEAEGEVQHPANGDEENWRPRSHRYGGWQVGRVWTGHQSDVKTPHLCSTLLLLWKQSNSAPGPKVWCWFRDAYFGQIVQMFYW